MIHWGYWAEIIWFWMYLSCDNNDVTSYHRDPVPSVPRNELRQRCRQRCWNLSYQHRALTERNWGCQNRKQGVLQHSEAWKKLLTFCRRHFKCIFCWFLWKSLYFDLNFTRFKLHQSLFLMLQLAINQHFSWLFGLVPNRWQAIASTNND